MHVRYNNEVEKLKSQVLSLGTEIEDRLSVVVKAVERMDAVMAQKIIESDIEIDYMEVDLEEDCLKILALYQPVAADLRYIISVLKINSDLERIGDMAVNIAERVVFLSKLDKVNFPFNFSLMAEKTQNMLRRSLDSLVNMDINIAYGVISEDDKIDAMHRDMYSMIKMSIKENANYIEHYILLLDISRHLERIADHATNIAEDVIYLCKGEIVRHRAEDFQFLIKENGRKFDSGK